jgi:hypothetical protein
MHNGPIELKVDGVLGVIVYVTVAIVPHCPSNGVNVYVAELVVLTTEGDHVPKMSLSELIGKMGGVELLQTVVLNENKVVFKLSI